MHTLRSVIARRFVSALNRRPHTVVTRTPLAVQPLEDRVQPAAPVQFFFVPMPEQSVLAALEAIGSGSQGSDMTSLTTITATEGGTTLYYDQWEDGYETNLANPTQATTQVWGDGIDANGILPGSAADPLGIPSGAIVRLRNDIPALPRDPANIFFDGGDRIGADRTIAMSRAQFPVTGGSVISSAVEVRDTRYFSTAFTAPVGTNTPNAGNMFTYTAFYVQASQDNTRVRIDANADGDFADADDRDVVVNQGQTVESGTGVLQGGRGMALTSP